MAACFSDEVAAIREIRALNPAVPAKTLARRISTGDFPFIGQGSICGRPFLSTYSVIRRYDAKQKARANVERLIQAEHGKKSRKVVLA